MHTILIAHRDVAFAETLATALRTGGYFIVTTCPGPWAPERCIRCDTGYCPITDGADLMIYDPELTSQDMEGHAHNLAVDSALADPDVPMLLAWSPKSTPDAATLQAIRKRVPRARVAAHELGALLRQVHSLIGTPPPQLKVLS